MSTEEQKSLSLRNCLRSTVYLRQTVWRPPASCPGYLLPAIRGHLKVVRLVAGGIGSIATFASMYAATMSRDEWHESCAQKLQETRPSLPRSFDDINVLDLGNLRSTSLPQFHSSVQLYPIGYVAERTIVSTKKYSGLKKSTMTDVIQMEIKSTIYNEPEFIVTNLISGKSFSSYSESTVWKKFDAYHDLGENGKTFYSFFNLEIELLIEGMDGALKCTEYKFHVERGYGTDYDHNDELLAAKSKCLQGYDRERRNRQRELSRSMSIEEKKLQDEQTTKQNALEKELDRELKSIQADAVRSRLKEEKELARQQKDLENNARKEVREDVRRKKSTDGLATTKGRKDDKQDKERQALEDMKKDKSFREINVMLTRIKTDAYSKLLLCFDKEEDDVEDREKLLVSQQSSSSSSSSNTTNNNNNSSMALSQCIEQCSVDCSRVFGTEGEVEAATRPIDWTNVIQVANYLRIFKQTLLIMGTADVDIDVLIPHMKTLSTLDDSHFLASTESEFLAGGRSGYMPMEIDNSNSNGAENSDIGLTDNVAPGDADVFGDNVKDAVVNDVGDDFSKEGEEEDHLPSAVDQFIESENTVDEQIAPSQQAPESSYGKLQKSISNIDRIHLNIVRAFCSEFPVISGGGGSDDSEVQQDVEKSKGQSKKAAVAVQPRLPINQMTWAEIARMSIISVLMIELGRRKEEIKYAVCGSKFHIYRSANSIVRSIRYRLAVQARIETMTSMPTPTVDLFENIARNGKSSYNHCLFLNALDQEKDSLSSRLLMRAAHDTQPPQPLFFESENDIISQLQDILRDTSFDSYGEVYHRCCKVFLRLFSTSQAKNFLWEVDSSFYPDYYSSVRRPIMLVNVATSLITKSYSTPGSGVTEDEEWETVAHCFYSDMMQIFTNCFVYNTEETVLAAQAYKLMRVMHRHCQRWLLTARSDLPLLEVCDESHCLLTLKVIPPAVRATERADVKCETCGAHYLAAALADECYKRDEDIHNPSAEQSQITDLYPYLFLPPDDIKEDWLCPFCLKEGSIMFRNRLESTSSPQQQHFFFNEWGPSTYAPWLCNGQFSLDWQQKYDASMSVRLLFDALKVLNSPSKACSTAYSLNDEALPWSLEDRFSVLLALCEVMMNHSSCSEELGRIQKECGKLIGLIDKSNFRRVEFIDIVRNISGEQSAEKCRQLLEDKEFEDTSKDDAAGGAVAQVVEGRCLVCVGSTFEEDCDLDVIICDGCNGDAHLVCLKMTEVPKNDWYCSSCQARKSSSKDVLYDKKFPIDDYRTYSEESLMVEILAEERGRSVGISADELVADLAEGAALCQYCGMPELALCSPFVCGQTRDEHEAHLDANKLVLQARGYVKDKPLTTVKLYMDGYQLEPPPLSIPYFPLVGSKNAEDLFDAHNNSRVGFEQVIVHELCALKMFKARMSRKKHGLRRERLQVAHKAIMMSGVTTQALGKDDCGREYWKFVCSDYLFIRTGASEEAEKLLLRKMLQNAAAPGDNMDDDDNDDKISLPTVGSANGATWRAVKSYEDVCAIIDVLGLSKNERQLRKVLSLEFPLHNRNVIVSPRDKSQLYAVGFKPEDESKLEDDEDDAKEETAALPMNSGRERVKRDLSFGEDVRRTKREAAHIDPSTPSTLAIVTGKGAFPAKTYVIREETAFEDVPEEPSFEYMEFSKRYYAIAIYGPTGRKLNLGKTATVTYQLHYEGYPHAIVNTVVEEAFRESIYYFAVPAYKKSGNYTITFSAEGDVVANVEPVVFKVAVTSEAVRGGLPNGLNQLRAFQFLHERNRQFVGRRIPDFKNDPSHNREIIAVKTAMRAFYYALPQGSVYMAADLVNPRSAYLRDKDLFHTLAQGVGWSDELDQLWTSEVERAVDARSLMELMVLLEHSISDKWFYTDARPNACLQAAQYAVRCASFSSISLRIFILDKAIDYKKFVVPKRVQRGGGVLKSESEVQPAYTTVTTFSGRKSKAVLSNLTARDNYGGTSAYDAFSDEPKKRGRPRKNQPGDESAEFYVRPEGLRARSKVSYAEDQDEDLYNAAAEDNTAAGIPPHQQDENLDIFDEMRSDLVETLSAGKADFGLNDDDDIRLHLEADSISNLCSLDLSIRCLNILHRLFKDPSSSAFWYPVTDDVVPGYSAVIANPMDLGTISAKVKDATYGKDHAAFASDMMLVFNNCFLFNHKTSYFYKSAKALMAIFEKDFEANIVSTSRPGNPIVYIV